MTPERKGPWWEVLLAFSLTWGLPFVVLLVWGTLTRLGVVK